MIGSISVLLSVFAFLAGVIGVHQAGGMLVLPSVTILAIIVAVGVLDVLAGFIGAATLALGLALTAGIWSAGDLRFLFGIIALGVVPRVISGAFRTLRRQVTSGFFYTWERTIDLIVSPMLAAWASLQIVSMLPVLAGVAIPVAEAERVLPLVVALVMILRVALEEITGRFFPDRIAFVQVDDLPKPPISQLIISNLLRGLIFAFVAEALIGNSWHLYVGALIFVLPNFLSLIQNKLPNSRKLYHVLPQGLTNLALSLWVGQITLLIITSVFQETPDLARIGFVLLPLPSLVMSLVKLFGRHGHEGEPRFHEQPKKFGWVYKAGTVLMIFLAAELTHTINVTELL
jgi:hypothetical protein